MLPMRRRECWQEKQNEYWNEVEKEPNTWRPAHEKDLYTVRRNRSPASLKSS